MSSPALTDRNTLRNFDAIIIGAGVIGCSIALALTRRGYTTLNVDALPAAGYGSTSHSSAVIRPFYSHVPACAIAHESRHRWLTWQDFLGPVPDNIFATYTECGGLILVRDGTEHDYDNNLRALNEVGVDYQMLDPIDIERMYPGICLDAFGPPKQRNQNGFGEPIAGNISGGIYIPASGYVSDPQLAARNLQATAALAGAEFRFNTTVEQILRSATAVTGIKVNGQEPDSLSAPIVVNAAGPHSFVINELAGIRESLRIVTQPHRHEVAYLEAPSGYVANAGFVVDLDTGVYLRPDGADMLIGSADPACDHPDIVDPDNYNTELTDQWTTQAYRAAQRWPDLGIENTARGTVGLYDVSNDWIPIYDKTDLPGFFVAIGTSGNQFKNAPIVGDIMAAIITTDDHDAHPAQLDLSSIDRKVDLSFYSRNREIRTTTSVMA